MYLFSGLIYCKECGSPLYGYRLLGRRTYYICSRARRRHDCGARHIPSELLETAVTQKLLEGVLTVENLLTLQSAIQERWIQNERDHEKDLAGQQKKYTQALRKIHNFTEAIGKKGPGQALLDGLERAEKERDQLERELTQLPPKPAIINKISLSEIAERLRDKLINGEIQERKAAINQILQRVTVWRTDDHIEASILYRIPETNIPP